MRVTSHTDLLEKHAHGSADLAGEHPHSHVRLELLQTAVGLVFILNSFLYEWLIERDGPAAAFSAAIGALILGLPILRVALKDLHQGALNTNVLVALAVLALLANAHYQEAGIVSFFMLLGQIVEARTAEGALASIHSLIKLTPAKARRLTADVEEEVAVHQLKPGDLVRVRPGDTIAADGRVVRGGGSINQASVTGESLPADRAPGDEVFAGTINLTGLLDLQITRVGADTTLGRVRELILAAEKTKSPIMRLMDQYMGLYTPLVLVIGGLVWSFTHDLNRVVAIFIVSCPCAFVLASPTALVAALSAAARMGILIKNVADLEIASRITAFVLDKTGTLTTGHLAVSRLAPAPTVTPAELLRAAASAERFSNHPTAKALTQLAETAGLSLAEPSRFTETAGRGVRAQLNGDGVLVGRPQWLREHGITAPLPADAEAQEADGWSLIFVAQNQHCIGWVGLQDQTRPEARDSILALRSLGIRQVALVSGDRQRVAERVSQEVGCDQVRGDCLPQDKVDFIQHMRAKGYRIAFVGDGVNDAPALAAGDLGIAMGAAGSEVALHTASIALMNNDLRRLPFLIELSGKTRSVINQNFVVGLAFVIGGMVLGGLSYITPVAAAIFHVAGSLLVVFNSFRLMRLGEDLEPHNPPRAEAGAPVSQPGRAATHSGIGAALA